MELSPAFLLPHRKRYLPLLDQLQRLFKEMDRSYEAVAAGYGFICNGCTDNCCLTRFYHHTLLEYLYLMEGIQTLSEHSRGDIRKAAHAVIRRSADPALHGQPLRIMCPLNQDGRCRLYPHRPMICRLHGLPHELHPPGRGIVRSPGCDAFYEQCRAQGKTDYIPFDRTPFYRRMAVLEKELRRETGYGEKISLTIAQMLETITDPDHEIDSPERD